MLKVEAGKITLQWTSVHTSAYTVVGAAATADSRLVLNGINGHLCSVFYDSSVSTNCDFCAEARFDIVRSTATNVCKPASCDCACSC